MVKIKDLLKIITYLCVLTGYASIFPFVAIYYHVGFIALMTSAVALDLNRRINFPRWVLNCISFAVLLISSTQVSEDYLVEPVVGALLVLSAIKMLENKRFRDYMQIYTLSMFMLLGSCLLSFSAFFLIYFCLLAFLVSGALSVLAHFSEDGEMAVTGRHVKRLMLNALAMTCIAVPSSALFFIVLPRINYPVLSFLTKSTHSNSGFGNMVSLGDVSEIQEDSRVVFRAGMERVQQGELYWRGIVLDEFNGTSWSSSGTLGNDKHTAPELAGKRISQDIYLEPSENRVLFGLDKPVSITQRGASQAGAFTYKAPYRAEVNRFRYKAVSVLTNSFPEEKPGEENLRIPKDFSPQIRNLTAELTRGKSDQEAASTLLKFLQRGAFVYSLEKLPVSEKPLDEFLLNTKRGNCEYFASAFAVMMRLSGIPARLIGGYRGGVYNPAGGYYMVTQKDAHVWVEAYLSGRGWLRLEPTPVSTDTSVLARGTSVLMNFRLALDTFNYYWNRAVLDYDLRGQLEIFRKIGSGFRRPDIQLEAVKARAGELLPIAVVTSLLALCAWGLTRPRKTREEKLIGRFLKRMAGYGYQRRENEGLQEFVERVDRLDIRERAGSFVADFHDLYYRDRVLGREECGRLGTAIRKI